MQENGQGNALTIRRSNHRRRPNITHQGAYTLSEAEEERMRQMNGNGETCCQCLAY